MIPGEKIPVMVRVVAWNDVITRHTERYFKAEMTEPAPEESGASICFTFGDLLLSTVKTSLP